MRVYEINEIDNDKYYALQSMKRGQWMYCSQYSCINGAEIASALEKENNAVYADPSDRGEWRIVDCD